MRLHQVLTGAANVLENSVAVGYGSTAGYPFTVYGSGYEVVVLDSHFNRVQVLSTQDAPVTSIVKCIACGSVDGKIAASYGKKVILFEPQPVTDNSLLKLPFHWKRIAVLNFDDCEVQKLCWDEESGRLLVGTDSLTMWRSVSHIEDEEHEWSCVWKRKLASPVYLLEFSHDGRFFASSGKVDCMIKIWFKAPKVSSHTQQHDDSLHNESYNFIYVLHPEPVQNFSWREISKHMPICIVPNVLLTSCSDNVCRIWVETIKYKPSHHVLDKKMDFEEKRKDRAESDLKHKTTIHMNLDKKIYAQQSYHLVSMYHFHLAAIINPSTDIALLSTIPTQSIFGRSFQLQWLNNKEVALTTAVEAIYASLKEKKRDISGTDTNSTDPFLVVDDIGTDLGYEEGYDSVSDVKTLDLTLEEDQMDVCIDATEKRTALSLKPPDAPILEEATTDVVISSYQDELNRLIHNWCKSSDTLYCIHPVDGSLLIWVVDFIDDFTSAFYRQVQVSFASRIPATFTKADATSLCWTHNYHYTQTQLNPKNINIEENEDDGDIYLTRSKNFKTTDKLAVLQSSYMVSAHADGSLNLWLVTFSDSGSFMGIASITHVTRSCGPRFGTTQLVAHPNLPLVMGTSQRTTQKADGKSYLVNDIESELILWHTHHVSPLSEYKGVTEMARISSPDPRKFLHVSWVPDLFQFPLLSVTNDGVDLLPNVPSACFVAASNSGLHIYQILLDAKSLLSNLGTLKFSSALPNHMQTVSDLIESEQSGSQSACIMNVCDLMDSSSINNVQFLHVFCSQSIGSCVELTGRTTVDKETQEFFILVVNNNGFSQQVCVWKIQVCYSEKFLSPLSPPSVNGDVSPMTPGETNMTSFLINHCIKQEVVYKDVLSPDGTNFLHFASTADLHSSSEIISSFPVKFHFTSVAMNFIKFWELQRIDNDEKMRITECHSIDTHLPWDVDIVCLSCASSSRFAFISKKRNDDNKRDFCLHIKENETSGEEVWNNEYQNVFCRDVDNTCDSSVELSWLSLENGQYLLAAAVNNQVFVFCRNRKPVFGSSKGTKHIFHWEILKEVNVSNELNDLFALTTIAWTGSGFFMVGVENEIQVYSQWEDKIEVIFKTKDRLAAILTDSQEQGVMLTTNSFTVACQKMTCLPQYHPDYLVQLLNLGKMRRIRAILRHLVGCVAGVQAANEVEFESNVDDSDNVHFEGRSRAKTLTKTYSNLSEYSSSFKEYSIADFDGRQSDSDIDSIPPLTLTELLKADKDQSGNKSKHEEEALSRNDSAVFYSMNQARLLTEHLSKKHLPGLSSQEQMSLLALSDTIASSKDVDIEGMEVTDNRKYRSGVAETNYLGGGGGYATTGATGVGDFASDSVDECGLRFLILLRHHTAILKSLSPKQKVALEEQGMLSSEYCWAFHSDCTEELLAMLPRMKRNQPSWNELRCHGAGWWIRSNDILKRIIEKVAKTHFQMNKDPLDCAIFYLAMKKKSLLCALYRSLRDTKMSTFFNNDFNQERWRRAALKNAYALLGKQRFEHAAAFFLLGNALWDAVQVCVTRLHDIQLALVIARLFTNSIEGEHNRILKTHVLGYEEEPPDEDPFKHSMAHWILKEYHESVDVFLVSFQEDLRKNGEDHFDYPSIFNFYNYLRTHPLIRRRHLSQYTGQTTSLSRTISSHPSFSSQVSAIKQSPQAITKQLERSLCFHTACIHLNSGLPDIALEVLVMLPTSEKEEEKETIEPDNDLVFTSNNENMIVTGTFSGDLSGNSSSTAFINGDVSSSRNVCNNVGFGSGWGSDDKDLNTNRFADLDDGYKISISLSDDENDDEDDDGKEEKALQNQSNVTNDHVEQGLEMEIKSQQAVHDIAALNLKFRCIVQMLIEALKALPSKCALEKLKLRQTLKELIRKELEYLHSVCNYGCADKKSEDPSRNRSLQIEVDDTEQKTYRSLSSISNTSFDVSAEEFSLSEKVEQISVQSEWLKRNQKILASLYEHCLMVGTGDPELPAVCVELLLLLHEIEDHRVLNSPLTSISVGPSAPPLLLASISSFSLVASPVGFLQSMAHDLFQTVIDLQSLPSPRNPVKRLADLESLMCSLSSCIYHSLCGGDDDRLLTSIRKGETQLVGKQMKDGKLGRLPKGSVDLDIEVTSSPARWPGVKFFLSILSANKKEERNSLNLLLCEAAVAVYLSMFVSACSRLSCSNLYRFVLNDLTEDMWNDVFGGGSKVVIPAPENLHRSSPLPEKKSNVKDAARMRWNYKLLGKQPVTQTPSTNDNSSNNDNQKLVRHELFIPPKISLCDYFLKKPKKIHTFDYDSDEEESDDEDNEEEYNTDVEDDGLIDELVLQKKIEEKRKKRAKLSEHFDSSSYPWLIMKLALVELTMKNINDFISLAGLEISDLPTQSTLLYNATKILERWEQLLCAQLDTYPLDESLITFYASPSDGGVMRGGMMLQKTKILLDPDNTPFSSLGRCVGAAKRLWHILVQKELVRSLFLHYAFKSSVHTGEDATDYEVVTGHLLHKDPEPVTNLCISMSNTGFMSISSIAEIIEYDISGSMEADLYSDETQKLHLVSDHSTRERKHAHPKSSTPIEIQRRPYTGVRRMASHPNLPYYVTGSSDGSVRMFEFIHPDQIALFRPPGQHERVNKIAFNPMGNKFAAVDDSGFLCVWQVASTQDTTPFYSLKCHSKNCVDFSFLGSSSLVATVGSTTEKRNVCVWDTLLSSKKALVHSFSHGNHGASCVTYVPGQQCIITGGKRGDICIFDIRHGRLLHSFNGHDALIKIITLDPMERFFVTGSVDGDIKVWNLVGYDILDSYPKEHSRGTVSLRQISPGVQCLRVISPCKLFSCGGDGTVKWRQVRQQESHHML